MTPVENSLTQDFIGAGITSSIFIGVLIVAELWRRLHDAPAERTRKLVHLGGGLACLLFPFLVDRLWIIALLAIAMTALFAAGARFAFLPSLHDIRRRSHGAEYYPLAVILLLLFAGDRTWLYVAALLTLAVGDAFAALIGSRYGVIRYQVDDCHKTLEGSLVFFIIAFQAVFLPTLLMTDLPRPVCVLASTLVAVLVTFFEAISLKGSDNLFVPLGTAVILESITRQSFGEIVFQNISLLGICLGMALLSWKLPYFNPGSVMALVLYAYGAWSFGAWHWALPIFAGLLFYLFVWALVANDKKEPPIRVSTTVRALIAPFLFVALAGGTGERELFLAPYLAASACVLALALADPLHRLPVFEHRRHFGTFVLAVVATGLVLLPLQVTGYETPAPLLILATVAPLTWLVLRHEWRQHGAPLSEWSAPRFLVAWVSAAPALVI